MTEQQYSESKSRKVMTAIKKMFTGWRNHKLPVHEEMSEKDRMELALAIAEQYILVAEEFPIPDNYYDGQTLASSPGSYRKFLDSSEPSTDIALKRKRKESIRDSFIFVTRNILRPRTASAASNSTICDLHYSSTCSGGCDCAAYNTFVASRENPLCC
ncbi:hypothetical protein COEREDRAFT_92997 [Coemansia reversa NRRL 1564]|uniref:Uncharacterized protein n=1 Tax=Coemansia reversa (strain ATCC 12441 / NRRL 1564) TaxID=763665 RepID=A0A2G5B9T3_COERN|nr:hypothetical protein COEREDRAFT_92997 [Coemansia reversa NRRL 1564]|eukprot:PIA15775.1 hypothetical protein COEREDRAFT_92997 [Coemansia reversa NRRL 1564]